MHFPMISKRLGVPTQEKWWMILKRKGYLWFMLDDHVTNEHLSLGPAISFLEMLERLNLLCHSISYL